MQTKTHIKIGRIGKAFFNALIDDANVPALNRELGIDKEATV